MDQVFSLGSWIRKRRTMLGLTREAVAQRAGYSVAMLRKIEGDERRPSPEGALLLAKALEIPPEQQDAFLKVVTQEHAPDRLYGAMQDDGFPWQAGSLIQSHLPVPPTPFVGREKELAELDALLRDPGCRLITLIGLAGIGKTRLALQLSDRYKDAFTDGVFFVPLAALSSPGMIGATIANAIGFQFHGASEPEIHLLRTLQGKQMLLVLDNFEHLMEGAGLLSSIMQATPGVRFLVTSRQRLNLQGEWVLEVGGLTYPLDTDRNTAERLESYEAVQLFQQVAARVNSRFTISGENWTCVVHICRLLEGMPLGIELAAAWSRVLPCQEIVDEIQRNLDFLRSSARDIPERHRSLRAALEHSWNLLSTAEQETLKRVSVFRGGFHKEAAWEVAGASLEELTSLLDKSLLKRVEEKRYDLHELVRQHAAGYLQADAQEYARTRDRHSSYYAALLEKLAEGIRGPRQIEILTAMEAERDNFRLAWQWMAACQQTANIWKSFPGLCHFHEIRARFWEGSALLGEGAAALQLPGEQDDQPVQNLIMLRRVQAQQAYFLAHLDRYDEAGELLQQSLTFLRSSGDQAALAETLAYLSYKQYRQGLFAGSTHSVEESLALSRSLENPLGIAFCLTLLSNLQLAQGHFKQAHACASESLALSRDALGDPYGTTNCLIALSAAARGLGRYDHARKWAEQALQISKSLNNKWGMAQSLRQLGLISLDVNEIVRAENFLRQSVSQSREICDRTLIATALVGLGIVTWVSGANSESKPYFLEALQAAMETKAISIVLQALLEIAVMETQEGSPELALEVALQILQHSSIPPDVADRAGQLRSQLAARFTKQQIESIQARVQSQTLDILAQEILAMG
jgi:predicted ATPase/transcriptional regulator with XRE-family HTH domain